METKTIVYAELVKTFKLEDGKFYRLLKGGSWREVSRPLTLLS